MTVKSIKCVEIDYVFTVIITTNKNQIIEVVYEDDVDSLLNRYTNQPIYIMRLCERYALSTQKIDYSEDDLEDILINQ